MSDQHSEKNDRLQDQAVGLRRQLVASTVEQAMQGQITENFQMDEDSGKQQAEFGDFNNKEEKQQQEAMSIDELNRQIELLCDSKAEEYRMLGYEQVVGKDIWRCVSSKYKNGYPLLHVVVNDILSLKPDKFMNWLMMEAYRG